MPSAAAAKAKAKKAKAAKARPTAAVLDQADADADITHLAPPVSASSDDDEEPSAGLGFVSGSDADSGSDSDSGSHSGSDSGSDWGLDSNSDSDSLDNASPRKRRRTSPSPNTDTPTLKSAFSVPSRIKSGQDKAAKHRVVAHADAAAGPAALPIPAPRILAPIDATTSFDSLNVRPWLVQALTNMAIKRPTAIQKQTIPMILSGRDCIGGSRTGSGKTVAFAVPMLQKWAENPSAIFGLVLTPTRELALQIYEQFKAISAPQSLKAILITGGSDMRSQAIALAQRPHVVIATPGRLADHIRTSGDDTVGGLKRARFIVLDEADRLLAAGNGVGSMLPDVEECLSALPPPSARQTLLFTATITPEVRALKDMPRQAGREPVFVCEIDTQGPAIPATLNQMHLQVPVTHREHYLHMFLLTPANVDKPLIIFCNRTSTADFLHHMLRLLDHRITALHSKLPQRQRIDNLARFRASAARILVATDVAARGLDIPEVKLVINYDIPRDPDDYIHRVGRTARAGRKGDAVTFVGQRDVDLVLAIEQRVGTQLEPWREDGVNLEARVVRDALKVVGEKKREALLEMEENREVGGKRKRTKQKLRIQ
ncbi:P-loop containing nucleoside triphosphate hydrolase protein [Lasiosphaeria miniovina]|uniref:P-loop containing nucleoside triphosphate hydrolase protein n=1 Tax=Lasiosphaeria miniovina TaxID=1954250 RepID=A0AA40DQ20_9PEZI|nr:P-loop containing nucleoside triphosphate hydrolase protein [Lasiosphaeria miniovina]KAK0709042.1 P-loop containing nucleoside triphosphate hydrolase protein [Lasiosphaeria miniovina]